MPISVNRQLALKPQDLVVLFKAALQQGPPLPYHRLGSLLRISPSEVHASFQRAQRARLIQASDESGFSVVRPALLEFALHGAKYSFPAVLGPPARGMPTAYAGPYLRERIAQGEELVPVWPYVRGTARGISILPLYPTVPQAAEQDPALYDLLTLFDALRMGAARERELAIKAMTQRLA